MTSGNTAPLATAVSTLLRLEGPDALSLLHRITTQKLDDLEPGAARATLVCDFRGRLLRRAIVAVTSDAAVWVVADDAPGADLAALIDRQIFRDRIRLEDRSVEQRVVAAPGGVGVDAGRLSERDGRPIEIQVDATYGYRVGGEVADPERLERERIAAGRPRHGHEIHDAFNPFEVGLAHEVHLSKGCFTGQEALLRMMTYGGVRRALHAVAGEGSAPPSHAVLRHGDAAGGIVTSAIDDGDGWVGLAAVRNDARGATLTLDDGRALTRCEAFPPSRPLGLPERP